MAIHIGRLYALMITCLAAAVTVFFKTDLLFRMNDYFISSHQRVGNPACKSILFVVIFNNDFYANIPYIESMYAHLAGKVVFYGPVANSSLGIKRTVDPLRGFLQQQTIAQAWSDNPGYDGLLWMPDDIFVNFRLIFAHKRFSWDRVWLYNRTSSLVPRCEEAIRIANVKQNPGTWRFNNPFASNGQLNYAAFQQRWHSDLPGRYKKRQAALFHDELIFQHGSDFGYMPRRLMPEFLAVVAIESLRGLQFELFIPTFLRLLSADSDDVIGLNGRYLWRDWCPYWKDALNCSRDHFIHPAKLSSVKTRDDMSQVRCSPAKLTQQSLRKALACSTPRQR